jgi:hypothetical protein
MRSWMQDVNTTKFLLDFSFTNYSLARRCLDIVNQLLPQEATGELSPSQLDLGFTDFSFESWFEWPDMGGDTIQHFGVKG